MARSKDTPAARRRLLAYLDELRAAMRMDNWDIVLHAEPCEDEDAHAETWQHENHTVLNIRLSADFFDLEPAGIRNTLVHELTHAQHRDVTRLWEKASRGALSETQVTAWDEEFHVHMERFVAWIADRLEESMPEWDPRREVPKALPKGCFLHARPS
jgi:hypothetical protein